MVKGLKRKDLPKAKGKKGKEGKEGWLPDSTFGRVIF